MQLKKFFFITFILLIFTSPVYAAPSNPETEIFLNNLILMFTIFSFLLWFAFGRDEKEEPVDTKYPPNELNSAETGILYKGQNDNTHITSLMYYLASKGYIKITNEIMPQEKDLYCVINNVGNVLGNFTVSHFRLEKIKEYNGKNYVEKTLMDALFTSHKLLPSFDTVYNYYQKTLNQKGYNKKFFISSDKNVVTQTQLAYSQNFATATENINIELEKWRLSLYTNSSANPFLNFLMFVCFEFVLLAISWSVFNYPANLLEELFYTVFYFIFINVGCILIFPSIVVKNQALAQKIILIIVGLLFAIFGITMFMAIDNMSINYTNTLWIGFICLLVIFSCWCNLGQWTKEAHIYRNKILGFRNFLQDATIHDIKFLLMENPYYCFDIMPYAFALGIPIEKFLQDSNLSMQKPDWYDCKFSNKNN